MSLLRLNIIPDHLQVHFEKRLRQIASELVVKPDWLMQVFWAESRLKANAVNPKTKAVGLIQFMPDTAKGLGTTVEALRAMNAVQQLDYVRLYFLPYKGKMKSYYDVYSIVFFPALIGKPDNWVLQTKNLSPGVIAKQNPIININKDGQITVAEFKKYVYNSVAAAHRAVIFIQENPGKSAGAALALILFVFFYPLTINTILL